MEMQNIESAMAETRNFKNALYMIYAVEIMNLAGEYQADPPTTHPALDAIHQVNNNLC